MSEAKGERMNFKERAEGVLLGLKQIREDLSGDRQDEATLAILMHSFEQQDRDTRADVVARIDAWAEKLIA